MGDLWVPGLGDPDGVSAYTVLTTIDLLKHICSFQSGVRPKYNDSIEYWAQRSFSMFKWAYKKFVYSNANTFVRTKNSFLIAAEFGQYDTMKFIHCVYPSIQEYFGVTKGSSKRKRLECIETYTQPVLAAIRGGSLHCVVFLFKNGYAYRNPQRSEYDDLLPPWDPHVDAFRPTWEAHDFIIGGSVYVAEWLRIQNYPFDHNDVVHAAGFGQLNLLRWLIEELHLSPSQYAYDQACKHGYYDTATYLINLDSSLRTSNELHRIVIGGCVELFEYVYNLGPPPTGWSPGLDDGLFVETGYLVADKFGYTSRWQIDLAMLKCLYQHGCYPTYNVLHYAALADRLDVFEWLSKCHIWQSINRRELLLFVMTYDRVKIMNWMMECGWGF